jgi:hypothetical protein
MNAYVRSNITIWKTLQTPFFSKRGNPSSLMGMANLINRSYSVCTCTILDPGSRRDNHIVVM